ncbi:hypothetical protein Aperf_G00000082225 [Anoplocephala perfoliata]
MPITKNKRNQSTPYHSRSPRRNSYNGIIERNQLNDLGILSPVLKLGENRSLSGVSEDSKFLDVQGDFAQRYSQICEDDGSNLLAAVSPDSGPNDLLHRQCASVRLSLRTRKELLDENYDKQPECFSLRANNEFVGIDILQGKDPGLLFDCIFESARVHSDYQAFTEINTTSFAKIFVARHVRSGKTVCMKCSRIERAQTKRNKLEILRDIRALSVARHENIVKYMDSWIESDMLFMMEEYCFGGSLFQFMFPSRNRVQSFSHHDTGINGMSFELRKAERTLKPSVLNRIFVDIINALYYLHEHLRMVHIDVKPSNILIQIPSVDFLSLYESEELVSESVSNVLHSLDSGGCSDVVFKLTDFGRSVPADTVFADEHEFDCGDGRYVPLLDEELCYTFLCSLDVYALGVTLYQVAGGDMDDSNLERFRLGELTDQDIAHIPLSLRTTVKAMLSSSSAKRPTVSTLLSHCSTFMLT